MRSQSITNRVFVAFMAVGILCTAAAHAEILNLVNTLTVHGDDVDFVGGLAGSIGDLYTGDILWDEFENDIVGYHRFNTADGEVLATGEVPGTASHCARPTGMAQYGSSLFLTAFTNDLTGIVEFIPGEPATVVGVHPFQGTESNNRSKGLTHDGRFLWQAHYCPDQGHLYAIDTTTGDRINDLRVDPYPYGLAYDGRYFWVSHHDPVTKTSYIAKYDRSETQLATYSPPASMSGAAIGDLAVTDGSLFGCVLGSNDLAHFSLPPPGGSPPSLPSSVLAVSVKAEAGIGYDGKAVGDLQQAADYGQLPTAASVEHMATGSAMDVAGMARSYYDEAGKTHSVVSALAYGQDFGSDLLGTSTLTISKTILISPSSVGLPAGTPVQATATLSFNGLLQALRTEGESWPDAEDLAAIFRAQVIKTESGGDLTCFDGSVSLLGGSSDPWVQAVLTGSADTADLQQACEGLSVADDLAYLVLDHVRVGFTVPAIVGQAFDIDIIFHARAFIPTEAGGLGAEVAFGCPDELGSGYPVFGDPESYSDEYEGGPWPDWPGWIPEPSAALLLAAGSLLALRRRRKGLNSEGLN